MTGPPAAHEIEVTVLGPGLGESVLVHLGGGEWLIADCCVGRGGTAAPLVYLASLGVAPQAVRWLVATHWHDDHVRGFGDLVEACPDARVAHAAALEHDEFLGLVVSAEDLMLAGPSGVDEMRKAIEALHASGRGRPIPVGADKRLDQVAGSADRPPFEVWSLSPSDAAVYAALAEFATWAASPGGAKSAVGRPRRNHSAVALLVRVGAVCLLLGADLETVAAADQGWNAVLASTGRPQARSHFLKVPHHGSITAHHEGIWSDLLVGSPHAVVTPMRQGRVDLPREADVQRIAAATSNAWLTRSRSTSASPKRHKAVERTLRERPQPPRLLNVEPGRVTLRCPADGTTDWVVDAPDPAVRLMA